MASARTMRFHALASDYDGTLAAHGELSPETIVSLERLRASGRKLLLVTGRELEELQSVCDRLDLFDRVVAENGALLYSPATRESRPLGPPPSAAFLDLLRRRGVTPLSAGRVLVATVAPHETTAVEAIRELGLELQIIFNKGSVMVLPAGVNKRTGLTAALGELGLSPHNAVGIGDAENDHAFLEACECAVAVADALPALREKADLVTSGGAGAGVRELIDQLLADDLASLEPRLRRHWIALGRTDDDRTVAVPPQRESVLVAGTSGSGKTTLTHGFLERLAEARYQYCLFDPEGDFESIEGMPVLGDSRRVPAEEEVASFLEKPESNLVVRLIGLPLADRPAYFGRLLLRLLEMRARLGRPHWLVVDEAHHLLPSTWDPAVLTLPAQIEGLFLVTVHPEQLSTSLLGGVGSVAVLGESPGAVLEGLASRLGGPAPAPGRAEIRPGEALVWTRRDGGSVVRARILPGRAERKRHVRKYAEGELPAERSFFFRGPRGALNLRAQNLMLFLQIADGVDDETWRHHLRRGDYSRWFAEMIKDEELAAVARGIEAQAALDPRESRARIREAVEQRYTMPA